MATRIILLRHGQTAFNLAGRVQGQSEVELNQQGLEQASQAAQKLGELGIERIVSSDLKRAAHTAQIVGEATGVACELDQNLRERAFGYFEGLTAKELRMRYPEQYQEWKSSGECASVGIESRAETGARIRQAVLEHAAQVEGTLLVVSHGSALTQGIVSLLELDPLAWQGLRGLDNCHWSVLVAAQRHPRWRLAEHNVC